MAHKIAVKKPVTTILTQGLTMAEKSTPLLTYGAVGQEHGASTLGLEGCWSNFKIWQLAPPVVNKPREKKLQCVC